MPKRPTKKPPSENEPPTPSSSRPSRACTKSKKPVKNQAEDNDSDDGNYEPASKTPSKKAKTASNTDKKKSGGKGKSPAKSKNTKKKEEKPKEISEPPSPESINNNILSALQNLQTGMRTFRKSGCSSFGGMRTVASELEQCARASVVSKIKEFVVYKSVTPFDRRTTALAWHPKRPHLAAVGSKGGEIILWNVENNEFDGVAEGIGPGGSIQKIMFDINSPTRIFTCSIDGTFEAKDLSKKGTSNKETFLNTGDWSKWYTSFDVSTNGMTLITGENTGYVTLLSSRGEQLWRDKLHKSKVTNIQFSPREPWLFATTSTDNSVKLWDIRTLTDSDDATEQRKTRFLQNLDHEKAVNSAYFSNVDGTRLLTTDQHSQIRVYRGPHWDLEKILPHPHRQFQHLTPIKATWHPLVDLVVAGRYPDEKFPGYVAGELRTIDIINPDTGAMEAQISQPGLNKIASLNLFSPTGDALLSGMGQTVNVWKQKPKSDEEMTYGERKTNVKDIVVEEWPGYNPSGAFKGPKAENKKKKEKSSN